MNFTQTTWKNVANPVFGTVIAVGLQVGTGGQATASYFANKGSRGYAIVKCCDDGYALKVPQKPTLAVDLALIRECLKPSIAELAKAFDVSRQAVYDWQSGKSVSEKNAERIRELAAACKLLASADVGSGSQLIRRKVRDNKNLLQLIASDFSGESAANALISILRTEASQRESARAYLAKRAAGPLDLSEAGLPHLREKG